MAKLPSSIDETVGLLEANDYIADRSLATALYLSLSLKKPLFLEGEAGVGKTEIARVLSQSLQRPLIRLQCYEGLDVSSAVYEWNYARQMLEIRLQEATGGKQDRQQLSQNIFNEDFLIERPLLQAIRGGASE
ncbi:MAG TPA: ATPase, partial [Rhodospirillaceae bacterium]|nr:ATPase [Rhodospirillaceae bacterium]